MPFGRFKGSLLCDLPVSYLEWFKRKGGFPAGALGMQLDTVYEIKLNGLEEIIFESAFVLCSDPLLFFFPLVSST